MVEFNRETYCNLSIIYDLAEESVNNWLSGSTGKSLGSQCCLGRGSENSESEESNSLDPLLFPQGLKGVLNRGMIDIWVFHEKRGTGGR